MKPRRSLLAVIVLVLVGAGCGSATAKDVSRSIRLSATTDHACIVKGGSGPVVDWSELRNRGMSYSDAGVKDQALIWAEGKWHLLFSYVTNATAVPGQQNWNIASAQSTDFVHWSAPTPWTEQPGGMASPDLVRSPTGLFVATYDSPPGETGPVQAKPYYRTSSDLVHWSAPPAARPRPAPRCRRSHDRPRAGVYG